MNFRLGVMKLISVREYLNQENLTPEELANRVQISSSTLFKIMNGIPVSYSTACKFKNYNIRVLYYTTEGTIQIFETSEKESTDLIKYFHIIALKKFGNTIVLAKLDPDSLIQKFKELGLNVTVRESIFKSGKIENPHYLVEVKNKNRPFRPLKISN